MLAKNNTGGGRGRDYCPNVVDSDILPKIIVNGDPTSKTPTNERKLTDAASLSNEPSTVEENATYKMSCVWESLEAKGIPPEAREIMLQSRRKSTRDQYDVHFRKWMLFCSKRNVNPHDISVGNVIRYLTYLYNAGLGYSSINTARCALSSFNCASSTPIGSNLLVCKFMRGVFNSRPTQSRYTMVWDVKIVLNMFRQWKDNSELTLKELTLKTVTLVALITAQRVQSIHQFDLSTMLKGEQKLAFKLELLKQSRPSIKSPIIEIVKYPHCKKICVMDALFSYIERTEAMREDET